MAQAFNEYIQELEDYLCAELKQECPREHRAFAANVAAHVEIEQAQPHMFSVRVCHEGVTGIRYNLMSAMEKGLAMVGALAGAPTRIQVAAGVGTGLFALHGIREAVSNRVARVLLALYIHSGEATRKEIQDLSGVPPLSDDDVRLAIEKLDLLKAVTQEADKVRLNERVMVTYTSLPRFTPL